MEAFPDGHPRAPDGLSLSLFNASEIPDEASFSVAASAFAFA